MSALLANVFVSRICSDQPIISSVSPSPATFMLMVEKHSCRTIFRGFSCLHIREFHLKNQCNARPLLGSGGQPAIIGKWRVACHSCQVLGCHVHGLPMIQTGSIEKLWSQSTVNSDQIKEMIDILHGPIRTGIEI